ncbi:hypothetical protein MtrunA17_Chr7g0215241 [Medicago truncatula]|uniref:Uncharacterized protein n=1 Tax=Medicago truncatula TaxID=3880 RepID=A0A396GSP6_MEDTR|nr:hypothetical protein MtrunA17_Chr7g0215241 [Medicago truncatula]
MLVSLNFSHLHHANTRECYSNSTFNANVDFVYHIYPSKGPNYVLGMSKMCWVKSRILVVITPQLNGPNYLS